MHKTAITLAILLALASPQTAFALKRSDTMSDWAQASEHDRSTVLDELLASLSKPDTVSRSDILDCLNSAAQVGGHDGLLIKDIAQACSEPPSQSDGAGSDKVGI